MGKNNIYEQRNNKNDKKCKINHFYKKTYMQKFRKLFTYMFCILIIYYINSYIGRIILNFVPLDSSDVKVILPLK